MAGSGGDEPRAPIFDNTEFELHILSKAILENDRIALHACVLLIL